MQMLDGVTVLDNTSSILSAWYWIKGYDLYGLKSESAQGWVNSQQSLEASASSAATSLCSLWEGSGSDCEFPSTSVVIFSHILRFYPGKALQVLWHRLKETEQISQGQGALACFSVCVVISRDFLAKWLPARIWSDLILVPSVSFGSVYCYFSSIHFIQLCCLTNITYFSRKSLEADEIWVHFGIWQAVLKV